MANKLNILITGGAGFIGSYLTKRFIELGHNVSIITLSMDLTRIIPILKNPNLKIIEEDIYDFESLKKRLNKERIDLIFHLSAFIPKDNAPDNFSKCIRTNAQGTLNILRIADILKVKKFVYISSVSVYAKPSKGAIKEDHPTIPDTIYGFTKLIGESYCQMYALEKDMNITILRLAGVFGPGRKAGAEYNFIRNIIDGKRPVINSNDKNSNDSVYVEDVLAACEHLVSITPLKRLNIYNIASGESVSLKELIGIINNHLNTNIKPIIKNKNNHEVHYIYNIDAAKKFINYKPGSKKSNMIKFINKIKHLENENTKH